MSAQFMAPPLAMRMQAEADRAQAALDARAAAAAQPAGLEGPAGLGPAPRRAGAERVARDIADSVYEDVIGPRPARHRKDMQS